MSPRPRVVAKDHPYASWNDSYRKFQRTTFDLPAYAVDCVPFRWVLRESAIELSELYKLPYQVELEEAVEREADLKSQIWVQHAENQRLLLDTFFSAVVPQRTLLFIYAKESPVSDDPRRILIGVGKALSVAQALPYIQVGGGFGSVLWERVIRHSIRPTMVDGFLLPYHELLAGAREGGYDVADLAVFVPDEFDDQFSYASEHVTHDAALALILALDRAVDRIAPLVTGSWTGVRTWLSARLAEVWQARGPCPGLGAALSAFGIPEGVLLAHAAQRKLLEDEDPWPLVDKWLRDPSSESEATARVGTTTSKTWCSIPDSRRD
ncbi:MAG: hypothetical protein ACRD6W_08940, partial [Nitrososphaerales archaeon]